MPENPLLPNLKLQRLYAAMTRVRSSMSSRAIGTETILATLAEQLEPGDAVVSAKPGPALEHLFVDSKRTTSTPRVFSAPRPLAFAAGLAAGAQLASNSRLVVALLDNRKPEADWAPLLDQAQRDRFPLIVICPETPEEAGAGALDWATLARTVKKLQFPVLSVDGGDAVAMYRAMQESVLRARHGDGPALLWCVMPSRGVAPKSRSSPVQRLERYMTARHIPLSRVVARSLH